MTEKVFLDTNVLIAALTDEPGRGETATELLNGDFEFYTSLLNLMELRTVLSKKKRREQEQVEAVVTQFSNSIEVFVHETSDFLAANRLQRETLLYPMDCLILAAAEDENAQLASFDAELLDNGAVEPASLLD